VTDAIRSDSDTPYEPPALAIIGTISDLTAGAANTLATNDAANASAL
jgi:hypothetical protein